MGKTDTVFDVIIIGAGAAGMMAACTAADAGAQVLLLEKNEKAGKKIYITGKGRCNFTNVCETEDFFSHVPENPSFLYSSVYGFDARAAVDWFEQRGVRTKVERGMRAFPLSDHASDITRGLEKEMRRLGVRVKMNTEVEKLLIQDAEPESAQPRDAQGAHGRPAGVPSEAHRHRQVFGTVLRDGRSFFARRVIVATGGLSYPSTGSTGDGYRFARDAGHRVSGLSPSLVPFNVKEEAGKLQGLSLRNVTFTVFDGKRKLFSETGEMMFTHFGVTGPLVLSASAMVQKQISKGPLKAQIDLKPALTEEKLDARILREFHAGARCFTRNVVRNLYPSSLTPVMLQRAKIPPDLPVHEVTAPMRKELVRVTKHFELTLDSLRGFSEAVITRGGVDVRQIDPGTMESKLVKGLYFAGEVLDVDAVTGGFNLQIAWSTGHAAGEAAAASLQASSARKHEDGKDGL